VHDFPVAEGEDGDELIVVRIPGGDGVPMGGVFEYRDALDRVAASAAITTVLLQRAQAHSQGLARLGDRDLRRRAYLLKH
jgi:hypothetical protein